MAGAPVGGANIPALLDTTPAFEVAEVFEGGPFVDAAEAAKPNEFASAPVAAGTVGAGAAAVFDPNSCAPIGSAGLASSVLAVNNESCGVEGGAGAATAEEPVAALLNKPAVDGLDVAAGIAAAAPPASGRRRVASEATEQVRGRGFPGRGTAGATCVALGAPLAQSRATDGSRRRRSLSVCLQAA